MQKKTIRVAPANYLCLKIRVPLENISKKKQKNNIKSTKRFAFWFIALFSGMIWRVTWFWGTSISTLVSTIFIFGTSAPHCFLATRCRRCSKMADNPPLSPTNRWNLAEWTGRGSETVVSCHPKWLQGEAWVVSEDDESTINMLAPHDST